MPKKPSDNPKAVEAAANILFDKFAIVSRKYFEVHGDLKERMDNYRKDAKQILRAAEEAAEKAIE